MYENETYPNQNKKAVTSSKAGARTNTETETMRITSGPSHIYWTYSPNSLMMHNNPIAVLGFNWHVLLGTLHTVCVPGCPGTQQMPVN